MRLQVRPLASLSGLRIWRCCGYGVGQWLHLRLDPYPGNLHMSQVQPPKRKRQKNKKHRRTWSSAQRGSCSTSPGLCWGNRIKSPPKPEKPSIEAEEKGNNGILRQLFHRKGMCTQATCYGALKDRKRAFSRRKATTALHIQVSETKLFDFLDFYNGR